MWKAAVVGEYGDVEQLIHHDVLEDVFESDDWTAIKVVRVLINPIYAIEIAPTLAFEHEPMITEEEWIQANLRLLSEIGPEGYLRTLLNVLKGGYIAGPEEEPELD
jgi:hypothetical protein